MKVMLVNGSPHKSGCTNRALDEIERTLIADGAEVGRFWIGTKPISGCLGCGWCAKNEGKCVVDDVVNEFNAIAGEYDGYIFGSPVHYAGASGAATSFMDRIFYSQGMAGLNTYPYKPAAAICSARRAGTTATWDQLNKYFGILQMPIVTSRYWNMVHGTTPEEVEQDKEGLRTMRMLAHNMVYHLKCKQAGADAGILPPEPEPPARTNFIR